MSDKVSVLVRLDMEATKTPYNLRILECAGCNHRFLPTTQEQQAYIEESYAKDYAGFRSDPFFATKIRETLRRDLVSRVSPPAAVLDVGCGSGEFMQAAVENGYEVEGVDVSQAAVDYCRKRGLEAQAGNFLEMSCEKKYDLITMWDVVEHLRDPEAFLKRAAELLKPDGFLILKIPGYGRAAFYPVKVSGRLARVILGAPSHVQYFTPTSLTALLARCGFTSVEWMDSYDFRSRPPTRSLKRTAGRLLADVVKEAASNRNLYVAVRR